MPRAAKAPPYQNESCSLLIPPVFGQWTARAERKSGMLVREISASQFDAGATPRHSVPQTAPPHLSRPGERLKRSAAIEARRGCANGTFATLLVARGVCASIQRRAWRSASSNRTKERSVFRLLPNQCVSQPAQGSLTEAVKPTVLQGAREFGMLLPCSGRLPEAPRKVRVWQCVMSSFARGAVGCVVL